MRTREAVATLSVLSVLLVGCASAGNADAGVPPPVSDAELAEVTLIVGDQRGGSQAMLTAAGLLDDVPYSLEWSTFTSGPPLLEAVSAGAVDIGGVGNTPPIFAAAADANIAVVSAAQGDVQGDALLVPADSPLSDLADLRGRTIAVARGSSAHGQVLYNLRRQGMTPDDVTLSFIQPADAYAAFGQGRLDAWAVWDPYTAQAELEAEARVLADGEGTANGYTFQVAGDEALADPALNSAIRDYVVRLAEAQLWARDHPAEWAVAWSAETGLPEDVTRRVTDRGTDLPVRLDAAVVGSEQDLADAFTEAGVLPGSLVFGDFVDDRFDTDLEPIVATAGNR